MPGKMVLCVSTSQIWRAILSLGNFIPVHDYILAYSANVEYVSSWISFQWTKGQNMLGVTTAEAMLWWK